MLTLGVKCSKKRKEGPSLEVYETPDCPVKIIKIIEFHIFTKLVMVQLEQSQHNVTSITPHFLL